MTTTIQHLIYFNERDFEFEKIDFWKGKPNYCPPRQLYRFCWCLINFEKSGSNLKDGHFNNAIPIKKNQCSFIFVFQIAVFGTSSMFYSINYVPNDFVITVNFVYSKTIVSVPKKKTKS